MSTRLTRQGGEWIDRSQSFTFEFEGKTYPAYAGDTISSALWAAGEKVLGRSFKYHRPRGLLSFANHDINVMVTDGEDTNMRGDVLPVRPGMRLKAVNTSGGVLGDRKRFIDMIAGLLPVGFYYKAFHTPRSLFPFWERLIRNSAGLGEANFQYPRFLRRKLYAHCDVLVIGGGASGLSAALHAARQGLNVMVVDENAQPGGSLTYDRAFSAEPAHQLTQLLQDIQQQPNIAIHTSAYAAGYYADHLIPVVKADGLTKVRARAVVVASGAFEQPPVFRHNDLPGIMLGTAAQRLIYRYAVKPFETGVVLTANSQGYRVALDLLHAGVKVAAIVDMRKAGEPSALSHDVLQKGLAVYTGYCISEAVPMPGNLGVTAVLVCPFDEATGEPELAKGFSIACDGVAMSAGWAPAAALLYQAGTSMQYDSQLEQFVPARLPQGVFAAGKVNGVFDLQSKLDDGVRAAAEAMHYLGMTVAMPEPAAASKIKPSHAYPIVHHAAGKNFVDFDEDISVKDFVHAAQEGFDNIELMKRFTTVGMGPSQGKHSNMNAIRILARIRGLPVEKIGTTTSRPFFHPTPIGHLAGRGFHPHRETPIHAWHVEHGAVMTDVGPWKRPAWYAGSESDRDAAINAEVLAVRERAGLIDVGTLGKIEVRGPDAAAFLERFYTGHFRDQKPGRSRYALLLDESGVMVDDGIACRIAEDYFYVTAGTANAAAVYREMQRWQQVWQLDIGLVNVTGAYGAMNVAGPQARDLLASLTALPLGQRDLPMGAVCDTEIGGIPARIMRVGFVSDLAFEIHVPAGRALSLWTELLAQGASIGLRPFGTDAQRLLRLEMGHPLIGHDTDGLTHPFEAGSEAAILMDKSFFIGKRSLDIIVRKPVAKRLVPFMLAPGYAGELPLDCNLVIGKGNAIAGRVTSIAKSPVLQRHIGFAYVDPVCTAPGCTFQIRTDSGAMVEATVAQVPFIRFPQGGGQ